MKLQLLSFGLTHQLPATEKEGDILVLELRYVDAQWSDEGTVHVELCAFMPEPMAWQYRLKGKWIESHASYQRMQDGL